jgi:hypothetical protein
MSPYTVRNLTGAYVPTNGKVSMTDVTPSEWLTSDPSGGFANVIIAWSGGAVATTGTRLFVHGGGHTDSGNNGVYVFDYSGTSLPTGWSLPSISTVATMSPIPAFPIPFYPDNRPPSVHTYNGMIYAAWNNTLYRFGGAPFAQNSGSNAWSYKFNLTTNTWTRLTDFPGSGPLVGNTVIADAATQKFLVAYAGTKSVAYYRTANDTWSAASQASGSGWFGGYSCFAYDATRGRGVIVGDGQSHLVTGINFTTEAVPTVNALSASGDTTMLSVSGASCVYDAARDVYWLLGGAAGSAGWTTLYEMNAATLAITAHTLTGDAIARQAGMLGSYGRVVLLDAYRALGIVGAVGAPASVIKLPDQVVGSPPGAPAGLTVR